MGSFFFLIIHIIMLTLLVAKAWVPSVTAITAYLLVMTVCHLLNFICYVGEK